VASGLAKGMLWSLIGTVIARGLALVSSVIVARVLGRAGFGELGVIQITVGMFQVFAGFGMGVTGTKHVAEFRLGDPEKAGRIVGLSTVMAWGTGLVVAVAMFAGAGALASGSLEAPHLTGVLRISSILLLLGAVSGAQNGALSGFEAFRTIAWVNLAVGVISLPLMVAGALLGGLAGAVWGLAATLAANCVLGHLALRVELRRSGIPVHYRSSGREWRVLLSFSLPAVLSGLLIAPVNWLCQAIMVRQAGGFDQMGLFNAANQWRMAILFLPMVLSSVMMPTLARLAGPQDSHRYRKLLRYNMLLNVVISAAVALPMAGLSQLIMAGYGSEFTSGYPVLIVLCLTTVIYSGVSVVGVALVGRGMMWWGMAQNVIWGAVLILVTWQLRHHGAMGLAIANLVAYLVHLLSTAFVYRRIVGGSSIGESSTGLVA
jgi:O-antigen/teichoic acid export membrane protein